MTPHRLQTSMSPEQPVRFYKIVALTFLLLTVILLGVIIFMSSKRATIVIETKTAPVDATGTAKIGGTDSGNITGVVTSTKVSITQTFNPAGTKTTEGTAAGKVTLYNKTSIAQTLIKTTRLLSPDNVLFRLKDRVVIPANGSVEADVYADQKGKNSEIEPTKFTVPGLSADKQKVIYAQSSDGMKGGAVSVGAVSDEDLETAKKTILAAVEESAKKQLSAMYNTHVGIFKLESGGVTTTVKVGEEVDSYLVTATGTVVGVFYDAVKMNDYAGSLLAKRPTADTEIVQPGKDITVSLDSYDEKNGTARVSIVANGSAMLNPESAQLKKEMFFGKSREEVRRYVLQLDHVRGVDVNFSPAWMMSVPYIPDHVDVVVKNVE